MRKWLFTGAAIAAAGWAVWENSALQTTQLTIYAKRLPKVFDGFCVVHISDLHNTVFGKHNQKLLSCMQKAQPDIIVITGDLLNSYHTDMAAALEFAAQAARIAPCYYVSGNHESRISAYPWFRNQLTEKGIVVLENRALEIAYQGQAIRLIGLVDSSFSPEYPAVCAQEIASAHWRLSQRRISTPFCCLTDRSCLTPMQSLRLIWFSRDTPMEDRYVCR